MTKEFKIILTKRISVTVDADDIDEAMINLADANANAVYDTEWGEAAMEQHCIGERDIK